jgi:hypothetical protein
MLERVNVTCCNCRGAGEKGEEHDEDRRPPYLRPGPGPGLASWRTHTVLLYKAALKFNDMALDLWEKLLLNACEGHYRAALLEVRAWTPDLDGQ